MTAIVDFEDALHRAQKALQCPICLETMITPTLTKCGHRFCSRCLDELLKRKKQSAMCPLCKQPFSKRSLAKQTKFENIVKVVEKLAEAFQEDLVNPINADWCGADTLERDLSQGYGGCLLGTCEKQLPAAELQQHVLPAAKCDLLLGEGKLCETAGCSDSGTRRLEPVSGLGEFGSTSDSRSCSEMHIAAAHDNEDVSVDELSGRQHAAPSAPTCEENCSRVALVTTSSAYDVMTKMPYGVQMACPAITEMQTTVSDERMVVPVTAEPAITSPDLTADGGNKWPTEGAVTAPATPLPMVSTGDSDSVIVVVPDDETVCLSSHGDCDEAGDGDRSSRHVEPSVTVVESDRAAYLDSPLVVAESVPVTTEVVHVAVQLPVELHSEVSHHSTVGGASLECAVVMASSPSADSCKSSSAQPAVDPSSDCKQQSIKRTPSDDTALESQPAPTVMVCEDSCPEDMEMGDDVAFEEALISSNRVPDVVAMAPPVATRLVIAGCSLSVQDAEEAQRLARLHSGRYQSAFTSAVTHVVVRTLDEDESQTACELPAKVYLGIAGGCHIVTVSWVYDSLQRGVLLPEQSYRLRSTTSYDCCVKHSVLPASQSPVVFLPNSRSPSLLATWEVCCFSPWRRFSLDELHDLIMLCGARKVHHASSFSYRPGSSRVILIDMEQAKKENSEAYARLGHLYACPVADYKWLLSCIETGRPFVPEKGCTMGCCLPGYAELWNRANVPALFAC